MLTLTVKLLICSSFMFIYLDNKTTLAQPPFIYYSCGGSKYTVNSTYQRNLDSTLSALPRTNSGFGFFNQSTGKGNGRVNSVALCRGDVNGDVCQSCLNDSIVKIRSICPNRKEVTGYNDYCILRYSDQTILQQTGSKFSGVNIYAMGTNGQNESDLYWFNGALRILLHKLRRKAADGGPLQKFATGNASGPGFSNIYALVQCTPDLSEMQCKSCLKDTMPDFSNGGIGGRNFSRIIGGINFRPIFGGRSVRPMCTLRYETYQFFNETTDIPPTPLPDVETEDLELNMSFMTKISKFQQDEDLMLPLHPIPMMRNIPKESPCSPRLTKVPSNAPPTVTHVLNFNYLYPRNILKGFPQ